MAGKGSTTAGVTEADGNGNPATFRDVEADQAIRVTEPDTLETGVWSQG